MPQPGFRCHQAEGDGARGPTGGDELAGLDQGPSGRQHGVADHHPAAAEVGREPVQVADGAQSVLIPLQAQVGHIAVGGDPRDPRDHAQAGAQDGDHQHRLCEHPPPPGPHRGPHLQLRRAQVAESLVGQEGGQLGHQLAEAIRVGALIPQLGEPVGHDGVVDDGERLPHAG